MPGRCMPEWRGCKALFGLHVFFQAWSGQHRGAQHGTPHAAGSWRAGVGACCEGRPLAARPHQSNRCESDCGAGGERPAGERSTAASTPSAVVVSFGDRGGQGFKCDRRPTCACSELVRARHHRARPAARADRRTARPLARGYAAVSAKVRYKPLHATNPFHNDPALTGLVEESGRDAAWSRAGDPLDSTSPGGRRIRRSCFGPLPARLFALGVAGAQGCAPAPTTAASIRRTASLAVGVKVLAALKPAALDGAAGFEIPPLRRSSPAGPGGAPC